MSNIAQTVHEVLVFVLMREQNLEVELLVFLAGLGVNQACVLPLSNAGWHCPHYFLLGVGLAALASAETPIAFQCFHWVHVR
eukprot:2682401-Amphidinium_carterae.1